MLDVGWGTEFLSTKVEKVTINLQMFGRVHGDARMLIDPRHAASETRFGHRVRDMIEHLETGSLSASIILWGALKNFFCCKLRRKVTKK